MIQSIVFDVDDTLYDQQAPFRAAIKKVFPAFPTSHLANLYLRFRYHSDSVFHKTTSGEWSLQVMRFYRLNEAMKEFNWPEPITQEISDAFQQAYEEELELICLPHEVEAVFTYLTDRQIPIGIITNGPTDHQSKKIKQLQIEKWVPADHIIISESTGFQKPYKEIFDVAAKQFGFSPESNQYVFDSF